MKTVFPDRSMPYNLRDIKVSTVSYGTETLSFRGPKTWALVPDGINHSKTLAEFKAKKRIWEPIGCICRLCKTYVANLGFI